MALEATIVKLEVHWDPDDEYAGVGINHPAEWDWTELVGSHAQLLSYEDMGEVFPYNT